MNCWIGLADRIKTVMVEDMAVNLKPAAERGITTIWLDHQLDWGNLKWLKNTLTILPVT